jgi:hypothetical protein
MYMIKINQLKFYIIYQKHVLKNMLKICNCKIQQL